LPGAVFTLYSDSTCTTVVGTPQTADTNGIVSFGALAQNTYYMKETTPPANYKPNATVYTVVIDVNGLATITGNDSNASIVTVSANVYKITNVKKDFSFTKVDKTNTATGLPGAVFTLYSDSTCTTVVGTPQTADVNGVVSFGALAQNTYYMKETTAPANYKPNATVYTVVIDVNGLATITGNDSNASIITVSANVYKITNENIGFEFKKVDDASAPVAGAKFTLCEKENWNFENYPTAYSAEATSDSNGKVSFTYLDLTKLNNGYFYMKETVTPTGYSTPEFLYRVSFNADGTLNKIEKHLYINTSANPTPSGDWMEVGKDGSGIYNIINTQYKIEFTKTNADLSTALQGAVFELYLSADPVGTMNGILGAKIGEATSDANGKITFMLKDLGLSASQLPLGDYKVFYLKEKTPPTGYQLNTSLYRVTLYFTGVWIIQYSNAPGIWTELGTSPLTRSGITNAPYVQKDYAIPNELLGTRLPETGGGGWMLFSVIGGSLLTLTAGAFMFNRKLQYARSQRTTNATFNSYRK